MDSHKTILVFKFLFILLSFSSYGEAAPKYSSHYCDNSTSFTPNSTYQANIKTLLSHLSSNTSRSKNGFYNTTVGQSSDLVYGTFLCRGDISADLCHDCVASASNDLDRRCVMEKVGGIWYDECTVRYSDQNIFSIIREVPSTDMGSSVSVTDKDSFNQVLSSLMKSLVNRAAYDNQSGKKFATGLANFTSSKTLYGLVQCSPDLSDTLCFRCFQSAVATLPMCCDGKQGGRVLLPSCNIRYEMFPFFNLNSTATPTIVLPSPSSPDSGKGKRKTSSLVIIAVVVPIVISLVLLVLGLILLRRRAMKRYNSLTEENVVEDISTLESLQYKLSTIEAAVNNFSIDNKIGEGGFGEVYKGKLSNGQEVAVKRLSKNSTQGADEFKNELALLAKLQHKNLVRLLGFCLEGGEKLLVYEYVPNKSLNYFLFDPEKQGNLYWSIRFKIIGGIARGLLYLHEDSRQTIIHRDLKAGNILLDAEMNAKISDFGMARIFGVDQTQANTRKIVGTYGYMPPEYAMHGRFSVKSDVFSFGVLILEIISGKKNSSFYRTEGADDLLNYAWNHWRERTFLELLDSTIRKNCSINEVARCIHIALLCVQEDPAKRPTMTRIVLMLDSFSVSLPQPQKPPSFLSSKTASPQTTVLEQLSANQVSITELEPR